MTGVPTRVAVQVGARTVRVAAATADAEPWLVSVRPGADVAQVLVELFGSALPELVVVHPGCWPAARVAATVRELGGLAGRIGTLPVPLAAAGAGPAAVLDVGHTGTEVTWLAADGSVRACRTADVGGARLDEALAGWLGASAGSAVPGPGAAAGPDPRRWPSDRMSLGGVSPDDMSRAAPAPSEPARVRRVREQLSLLPAVDGVLAAHHQRSEIRATDIEPVLAGVLIAAVDLLGAVLDECGPAPVLVVGGVARTPLLAELVDAAGIPDVTVAARPDAAAVLGALRSPLSSPAVPSGRDPPLGRPATEDGWDRADPGAAESDEDPGSAAGGHPSFGGTAQASAAGADAHGASAVGAGAHAASAAGRVGQLPRRSPTGPCGPTPASTSSPSIGPGTASPPIRSPFPQPRRRPLRRALIALLAAAVAAGLLGAGVLLFPEPAPVSATAGVLVQYGYRLEVPEGWAHTGGLPQRRRVLLTRVATPVGSEVIAVERSPLGYDSAAERPRALAELRAAFDAAVAGGSVLSGYRSGTHAGREVVRYEQLDPDGRTAVDWFVLLEGDAQFSVGCRHNPTGAAAVAAACALVVGSVRSG
jgi:type VII secretion-associated protein (TIGR03931 family)